MVDISVSESESQVSASVGDRILIRLEEPGATGYQWATQVIGEAVQVEADATDEPPAEPPDPAPGQSVQRLVALRAVAVGEAEVCHELRRPWEQEAIRRVVLRVAVQ